MGVGWIWSSAATDADRKSKDLDLFFECIFLRYERENARVADVKKVSFVSICDSISELLSGFFCVVACGLIVEIENGLAKIQAGFDSVGCLSVLVANLFGIEKKIGGIWQDRSGNCWI